MAWFKRFKIKGEHIHAKVVRRWPDMQLLTVLSVCDANKYHMFNNLLVEKVLLSRVLFAKVLIYLRVK